MNIDLGENVSIKIKFGAEEILLREPTVKDIEASQGKLSSGKLEDVVEFLETLGMPKEKSYALGINQMKKLMEGLTGVLSGEKK